MNRFGNLASSLSGKVSNTGKKLSEALFGVPLVDVDKIDMRGVDPKSEYWAESMGIEPNDPQVIELSTVRTPARSGIIPDIMSGYRENYNNPLDLNNRNELKTDEDKIGHGKGIARRIGEGLGTMARFGDSSLGRGLLAYGLNNALGYDDSLQEGLTAAVGRQNASTKDRIYRQQLMKQGIETPEVYGNITDDIFKQIMAAKQLEDNAEWRKTYLQNQQEANKQAAFDRQENMKWQRENAAADRAVRMRGQDLDYQASLNRNSRNNTDAKAQEARASVQGIEQQLNDYEKMFKSMPGKGYTYTVGNLRKMTGTETTQQAEFESRTSLLLNKIARDLGGEKGVLSDQDIKRVKDAMPKFTDSYEQKEAKMKAIRDLLTIAKNKVGYTSGGAGGRSITSNNPLDLDL